MKNEIVLFKNQNVKLEVNMKDETVWLSLDQMAKLFGRDRTVITRHINNIFNDKELEKKEVCAKYISSYPQKNNPIILRRLSMKKVISIFLFFTVRKTLLKCGIK